MTSTEQLQQKITELEGDLLEAKANQYTYIHETHSLHCSDGEFYMGFGDIHEEKTLVFNVTSLFRDLPHIIDMVVTENANETEDIKERIKQTSLEL